ncbi:MarR family transcriptional regulator [Streptomyces oryzae]|uniref:MarR family transcriptional regulator n=1 Tax=Streptomyces oryzae TaxID=1434886 RepID=A0ABS3XFZ9_9ACTN|nr:MarR family transcriptional regulator [Streptomyces oryzae]MBO8194315.1 MarR family transcriptional regulator [Streptomyces oryzae]
MPPADHPRGTAPEEPGPGLDVVHQLRAVTVELDLLAADFARRNGLHPTDLRALIQLLDAARSGTAVTPGRLGAALGLNSAGTTSLIDRLERLGHVRRLRDPHDGRRVLLEVDERATALGRSFFGPLIDHVVGEVETMPPAELAAVRRFLAHVRTGIEEHREQG